jgi:hypothetical protein
MTLCPHPLLASSLALVWYLGATLVHSQTETIPTATAQTGSPLAEGTSTVAASAEGTSAEGTSAEGTSAEGTSAEGTSTVAALADACQRPVSAYVKDELWPKVISRSCLVCHKAGGEAEESELVFRDPEQSQGDARESDWRHNRDALERLAREEAGEGKSRLLMKPIGQLDHGGKEVISEDSSAYKVLEEFVRQVRDSKAMQDAEPVADRSAAEQLFQGVLMADDRRLLRRATLSLAGRLPRPDELAAVDAGGQSALLRALDAVMTEDAFYDRLREGFNDIFLTVGYDDGAQSALSYDHFSETRHWTQKFPLDHIEDEKARERARYKLTDDYRDALFGEPMKLIEYIVRHDRPFTEIVTADYMLITPYTARGYGIYEEVVDRFNNPDDPFEYIPVRLKALVGRNRPEDQDSQDGFYTHAGLLSSFQYLRRYPNTETNRNRLRARMVLKHFLGIDALELAARVSDAAAVTARHEIPTMQAAECVVCHRTLDPLAGIYQDFYKIEGVYGRRKGGWYSDMFAAGWEGEALPDEQRWRALPWLGQRIARDPRFAVAMVEHVYYILTGRQVLLPPKNIEDPLYAARRRAYTAQRAAVEQFAQQFAEEGFNLKSVFKAWIVSDFYRADGLATAPDDPGRLAELDDIGVVRLLAPEQIERKVAAIFGSPWGRLHEQMAMLYGAIDSKEVTERAKDPSGAMGAIQRILANDVACKHTLRDFMREPEQRILFPHVEPHMIPGESAECDQAIRLTIAHLHERILGQTETLDSEEVGRTFELFAGIFQDARQQPGLGDHENYFCRHDIPEAAKDPLYTIRAWRGVVTYLLRRQEFLYE